MNGFQCLERLHVEASETADRSIEIFSYIITTISIPFFLHYGEIESGISIFQFP